MAQIVVIDLGSQLCHLIARRVRELGVYSEVLPNTITPEDLNKIPGLKGIILSGGPASIYEASAPHIDKGILSLGIPVLGICYGHQLLAQYLGGAVEGGMRKEYGHTVLELTQEGQGSPFYSGLSKDQDVWMNHGDIVKSLPAGFMITATTHNSPVASFEEPVKRIYGVQFHVEVTHTKNGIDMVRNFVSRICKADPDWSMDDFVEEKIAAVRKMIHGKRAILGLSGGVDSSTCAALVGKAIGKDLTAIFIDTGFMRKGEPDEIKSAFSSWDIDLRMVDSSALFYERLQGVSDPELKRKIIGELFIREFEREAKKVDASFLVQGTIYPDVIESGSSTHASTIKSHHNVGGLPEEIGLTLCEPLRDLYKDEVRVVAAKLGLPDSLISRHPFPGPGLAIRIIGECTPSRIAIVKEANAILMEELDRSGFYHSTWQAFAVLLPIKSVGVQGDARVYKQTIVLRLVDSVDAMTANFTRVPYDLLERISTRITNEIREVGRVVYDITDKPPGTIEWE